MKGLLVLSLLFIFFATVSAHAQEPPPYYELDPKPYNPEVDVNMDMFMSHWKESSPRKEFGSLIIRDIFTKHQGVDPLKPHARGAVLNVLNEYAYGTLLAGSSTTPTILEGEQRVFYIIGGEGEITAGDETAEIYKYTAVLVPEGLEFSIRNTWEEPLAMIIIGETVPEGFTPLKEMKVRYENEIPIGSTTGHWVNINKPLFGRNQGLATIIGISPVWLDPMTMAQPHASMGLGTDVLWVALEGDIYSLVGKKLRRLEPGSAYKNPSDGRVYHTNINVTEMPIKLLWVRSISLEEFKEMIQ